MLVLKTLKAKAANELLSDALWNDLNLLKITASDFRFLLTYILSFKDIDRNQIFHKLDQLQEEGLQRGLQKGCEKGQIQLLQVLLRKKFRSIPRWADKRLKSATTEDFIRWSERILYKDTLKEIFD